MKPVQLLSLFTIPMLLVVNMAIAAQSIDKQLRVDESLKLNIKVLRGEVKVSSWDRDEISVKGTLDELSEGFLFEKQGGQVTLEDKLPRHFDGGNKGGSKLTIMVPKNLTLEAEGLSSNYALSSLSGKLEVYTVSGDVEALELDKEIFIRTVSGDIESSKLTGKIKLDSISGSIKDINSTGEIDYKLVSGDLTADTTAENVSIEQISGDGKVQLKKVNELTVKTISGDIELTMDDLQSKAHLDSVNGDIELMLPKSLAANFSINGGPGGKISNNLTDDEPKEDKYSTSSYLKFQTGNADVDIKISTISGSIKISE